MARRKTLKLEVLGRNCDAKKQAVDAAARFMLGELLTTRMINTLTVRIELRATKLSPGTIGCAYGTANGSIATKQFRIVLQRDLPLESLLLTLAHELIHLEQYATNRLQFRRWKSDKQLHARWDGAEAGVVASIPYRERPWEVDAYRREAPLARAWAVERREAKRLPSRLGSATSLYKYA